MSAIEGKLSIWIKEGKFTHASDLYVLVFIDDTKIWKTDEKDSHTPNFNSTVVKHVKGEYEKIVIKLMDEDTFSRDDVIGTKEYTICDLLDNGIKETADMKDADGNSVGTLDIDISYDAGDVSMFDLMLSKLHKDD